MAIRAVMFDFGGVISTSPFEAFARLEAEHGLPAGFIRTVNATNPDDNAWARLERNEIGVDAFGGALGRRARALGHGSTAGSCSRGWRATSVPRWWPPSRRAGPATRRPA